MMDVKVASKTEIVATTCTYWLAGRCTRNPCRFLHRLTPSCNTISNSGYHNRRKRHCSSYGVLHDETTPSYRAKKPHSSYVYQRKIEDDKDKTLVEASLTKTVFNKKIEDDKEKTQLIDASVSKHNIVADKTLDERESAHPSPSICKYWVNDSCVHGDQCRNLHSWFYGDKFTAIAKLQGHKKLITGMTIPHGLDKLLTGSTDGTVRTWDCHTGQCVNVENFGSEVTSLISEGPWIFVGLLNTVMAYNIPTASHYTLDGPNGKVRAMIVGNDTLLVGAENGVISAWRGISEANSTFKLVASLNGHTKSVVCLAIGKLTQLYSGSEDQTIKVWDLETFECKMTLNAHIDAVTSLICSESFLLSGSSDGTIKVWFQFEERNWEVVYSHNVENGVVALSGMNDPDNKKPILLCSTKDNSVRLYELPSFVERGKLFAKQEVGLVDVGPDGLFFTGDRSGLLTVSKWLGEYKNARQGSK